MKMATFLTLRIALVILQVVGIVAILYTGLMFMSYSPGQDYGLGGLGAINAENEFFGFGDDFIDRNDNFTKYFELFTGFLESAIIGSCDSLPEYFEANLNGTGCDRTFGRSWGQEWGSQGFGYYRQPIDDVLQERAMNTFVFIGLSLIVYVLLGVILGIIAGVNSQGYTDLALRSITSVGSSIPAILLLIYFERIWVENGFLSGTSQNEIQNLNAYGYIQDIFNGLTVGLSGNLQTEIFESNFLYMMVMVGSMAFISMSFLFRLVRTQMINEMRQPYIRTAVSKGLSKRKVVFKHALPNAAPNLINAIALTIPLGVTSAAVTEFVFGYRGLANVMIGAAPIVDFPFIVAGSVYIVIFTSSILAISDIITYIIDPRRKK